eukprot:scaffold193680_cov15-Prasinocladus_malaysianus.AAC.1
MNLLLVLASTSRVYYAGTSQYGHRYCSPTLSISTSTIARTKTLVCTLHPAWLLSVRTVLSTRSASSSSTRSGTRTSTSCFG